MRHNLGPDKAGSEDRFRLLMLSRRETTVQEGSLAEIPDRFYLYCAKDKKPSTDPWYKNIWKIFFPIWSRSVSATTSLSSQSSGPRTFEVGLATGEPPNGPESRRSRLPVAEARRSNDDCLNRTLVFAQQATSSTQDLFRPTVRRCLDPVARNQHETDPFPS